MADAANAEFHIREIRVDELDDAARFAEQQGCAIDASRVRLPLSLSAHDDQGRPTGVVFCVTGSGGGSSVRLEVVVAEAQPGELVRRLIDKVLCKLRCEPVHRCSIHVHHEPVAQRLWHATRWADDAAREPVTAA